jgi:galactokinase
LWTFSTISQGISYLAIYGLVARFTGAGGGGHIRALGTERDIDTLRQDRADILFQKDSGKLISVKVDPKGLEIS